MEQINNQELIKKISFYKSQKQSFINDVFFWVNFSIQTINEELKDKDIIQFSVPKTKNSKNLRPIIRQCTHKLKERILKKDIINSGFISIVSGIEDYFSKIIEMILLFDNRRIKINIKGNESKSSIELNDVIDLTKEELINKVINDRIYSFTYASPKEQKIYFKNALSIDIEDSLWAKWVEIKARRDLWIHNNGIIDEKYNYKTNNAFGTKIGEEALITSEYFSEIVASTKTLSGQIYSLIKKEFK